MPICSQCRNAISWASLPKENRSSSSLTWHRPSRLGDSQTIEHHTDCVALLASSSTCHICRFLSSFIPSADPERTDFLTSFDRCSVKLVETRSQQSLATCLQVELWQADDSGYTSWFNAKSSRIRSPIIGICRKYSPLSERAIWSNQASNLRARIQVINQWLKDCKENHSTCANHNQKTRPTRLLDIGNENDSSIKLIYSSNIDHALDNHYIALSHCWGSPATPIHRTTKKNHEEHLNSIPVKGLPQTFKDAIIVSRALRIRYLWIDSLCIIQDDEADWANEAAKMAHVYEGSYFTIAATSSKDGGGGLFLGSAPPTSVIFEKNAPVNDEEPICFVRYPLAALRNIWEAPLSKRAWVVQEQILSPRLVHFAENQLWYQCRSGIESEDGTMNVPGFPSFKANTIIDSGPSDSMATRDLSTPLQSINTWWSWVTEYSSRSLTFRSDRIAAVAGITTHYEESTGDSPLLGLWKDSIWFDLGWYIDYDIGPSIADSHIAANIPKWSWLSIQPSYKLVPTTKLDQQKWSEAQSKIRIQKAEIMWEGRPHTSSILATTLVLLGLLKPLSFPLPPPKGKLKMRLDFEAPWDGFLDFTIFLDCAIEADDSRGFSTLLLFSTSIYEYILLLRNPDQTGGGYQRLGAGRTHRPRGHPGLFQKATWTQVMLV
ncbi:heterokaryon incompatibility protein-domain-containing protein [Hypoxylon cercidicola]|nr:heterokaryon incompatibility protein-domain-containing protein [Hypoxylon cercidicola]